MNISALMPAPTAREYFHRNRERFIIEKSGCYILTNLENEVMYIGLTENLRRRFGQHRDSAQKTAVTRLGRAIFFCWCETAETQRVERTWMNIHIEHEGALPLLNGVYSPVSV